jgi:hypothetical protein
MKREWWMILRAATIIGLLITFPNTAMFRPISVHAFRFMTTGCQIQRRHRMTRTTLTASFRRSSSASCKGIPATSTTLNNSSISKTNGSTEDRSQNTSLLLNLSTVRMEELETLVTSWGFPKYRASQVYHWIRQRGITDVDQMTNIPKDLRQKLSACSKPSSLQLVLEQTSQKDGTIKRAYKCYDGQIIESVLMAYEDGRYTACISSQAGCAQGRSRKTTRNRNMLKYVIVFSFPYRFKNLTPFFFCSKKYIYVSFRVRFLCNGSNGTFSTVE